MVELCCALEAEGGLVAGRERRRHWFVLSEGLEPCLVLRVWREACTAQSPSKSQVYVSVLIRSLSNNRRTGSPSLSSWENFGGRFSAFIENSLRIVARNTECSVFFNWNSHLTTVSTFFLLHNLTIIGRVLSGEKRSTRWALTTVDTVQAC